MDAWNVEEWLEPLPDLPVSEDEVARRRQVILVAIEQHGEDLLATARLFTLKFALPHNHESVTDVAEDLLQATVLRALEIAGRFEPDRQPRPWLLGLLLNVAKEERRRRYRDRKRTFAIKTVGRSDEAVGPNDGLTEEDLLDRLRERRDEADLGADVYLQELLNLVSGPQQEVLHLFIVEDLSSREVGARLGISEGAASVRLHRALGHLRAAYNRQHDPSK